jgi:hypothetical protein
MAQRRDWRDSLVSSRIYLEGGGEAKDLHIQCRKGFRNLLESAGFTRDKLPKLVACGDRNSTFDDFKTAHNDHIATYVAILIDSEDPVEDLEKPWHHLKKRDGWDQPDGSNDDQVLFMTTCMETWIFSDHKSIRRHYGHRLQVTALPSLHNIELRNRNEIQEALKHATRNCSNTYRKNKRSFEVLSKLNPSTLERYLPSFQRMKRILNENLR